MAFTFTFMVTTAIILYEVDKISVVILLCHDTLT
jgi:hypothetical protein